MPADATTLNVAVIDSANGDHLAAARVQLVTAGARPHVIGSGTTDKGGSQKLEFPGSVGNELKVWTVADGYVPAEIAIDRDVSGVFPQICTVRLTPAATVAGVVLDETGKPISGVEVRIDSKDPATSNASVGPQGRRSFHYEKTDEKGQWTCRHVPRQLHNVGFRFIHPHYVTAEFVPDATATAGAGESTVSAADLLAFRASILMKAGLELSGVVVDSNQKPIEGAEIDGPDYPVWTPADGHFSFHNRAAGPVVLTAFAKGFAPQRTRFIVGESGNEARFQLERGNTLRLSVQDSKGRPVAHTKVAVERWQNQPFEPWQWVTDEAGKLTWDSAPSDDVLYSISHVGYETSRAQLLKADGQEHRIILHKQLQISGNVVDAETSTPVEEFSILPGQLHTDHYDWNEAGITNCKSGKYLVRLPKQPNPHVLQVQANGYYPQISKAFKDEEEEGVANFRLARGEPVSGLVSLPDGTPASKTQVALCTADAEVILGEDGSLESNPGRKVKTDDHGNFIFQPRRGTRWLAAANEQGYGEIPFGDGKQIAAIKLKPWGRITGVLRLGASPCSNQLVKLVRIGSLCPQLHPTRFTRLTDSEGRFAFERVPPGQLMIGRIIQSQFSHGQTIEIASAQTTKVTLGGIGRTVTGRMESADGRKLDWEVGNHPAFLRVPLPPLSIPKLADAVATNRWTLEYWDSPEGRARQISNVCYVGEFKLNNIFQVENVLPGTYDCEIHYHQPADVADKPDICLGIMRREVRISALANGVDDGPVDLGKLIISLKKTQ